MALKSAADITKRMLAMEKALSPAAERARLTKVATALKPLATAAAAQDLGADAAFSGWAKAGIPLKVRFTLHRAATAVTIHRDGKSAGPWRVADQGRNQGNAGGFAGPGLNHQTGVTSRTKTGKIRMRKTAARRWNGTTVGKGTWGKAIAAMEPKARTLMLSLHREEMTDAFVKGKA